MKYIVINTLQNQKLKQWITVPLPILIAFLSYSSLNFWLFNFAKRADAKKNVFVIEIIFFTGKGTSGKLVYNSLKQSRVITQELLETTL